ncbi:eae-like domain protein [Citrobacter amalonaticus]
MDSNISELVKLGHERADELKAACGAVDVRSVSQLISDLASQLEVQYVRAEESQREFHSADITMQNLEAKCEKLAAENAHMQQVIGDVQTLYYESDGIVGYHLNGDIAKWDDVMPDLWAETPATEAFLAEVRAQAQSEVIEWLDAEITAIDTMYRGDPSYEHDAYWMKSNVLDVVELARKAFADQLRKGVQS